MANKMNKNFSIDTPHEFKMIKNFFFDTPHEFQICINKKPFFGYDNSIHEIGVFPYCLALGWITICWGTWKGDN